MSNLEELIRRNVAGKNGGPAFYPGEPDPLAKRFAARAQEIFGGGAADTLISAESVFLVFFIELFRQSGDAPVRPLRADSALRERLLASYEQNKAIASPLFLATRHLIREMYSGVDWAEPVLELGMGAGDTTRAILGERKIAVGTTPIIDEIMSARHNYRNHRLYLAADAGQVPFADGTFNTVIMNYTFYHLEDAAAACREVFRVLAPGGRFHFNLALREAVEATRALPRMAECLGFRDYAEMARGFVFADYGSKGRTPTKQDTVALLEKTGFIGIKAVDYLSAPLSRLIWFSRDLQILFLLDLQRALGAERVEAVYREFVAEQIAPLLSEDMSLCAEQGATFAFVSARKPGAQPATFADEELVRRMACPRTKQPLERRNGFLFSRATEEAYPVYHDIPLLIPVYARIWREQNSGTSDPTMWRRFSY